ncbi:thioredoxin family protein [Dickeya chrysanthemi]|uniref:Thioredoxin family protein n=1 Tax=Dickeya chrysanthemi TaxID=556 RepID=A0ABU8JQ50_DICCH
MATYKQLFDIGESFGQFVKRGLEHEIAAVNASLKKLADDGILSKMTLTRLNAIKQQYHLLVAGEMWCSDCHKNMAAMHVMCQYQPSIRMSIITKGHAEDDLQLDDISIPMVAILDSDFNLIGSFLKKPSSVVHRLDETVMTQYNAGLLLEDTITDILAIIYHHDTLRDRSSA